MREYLLCLFVAASVTYLVTPVARRFALSWGAKLEALGAEDVSWQRAIRIAFQRLAELKVRRERDLLMLSAEQMYRQFAQGSPDLLTRIAQKDLAAFLGVTAVGLNRIIRRVERAPGGGNRTRRARSPERD